jgi:alkylation response protein AidB-like acyl-CoA dehydrogenase
VTTISGAERDLVAVVRRFVDERVRPVVRELDHSDTYPAELIDQMKEMGLFGMAIGPPYAEERLSTSALALVTEELCRGWMSLGGALGGHLVISHVISRFGTDDQKQRYLPGMVTGEVRAAMALTEPAGGSDLAAIRTFAAKVDGGYCIDGSKTWISNAMRAGVLAVLCKTDRDPDLAHRGISLLLVEKGEGVTVGAPLGKLGYHGVESCEVSFDGVRVPHSTLVGGVEGKGFMQMMTGLELGRIQVAARSIGVARAALEDSLAYSQQRRAFGRPIWEHQAVGHQLAEMATRLTAARLLVLDAAEQFDRGERSDMAAAMAKLFASEAALANATSAMRIHGAYGYSTEYHVERYYRDAPLMVVGEGTNEIQRILITAQLVARGGIG